MKAIAMGTTTVVAYASLICRYLEIELILKLPEIFSHDILEFFLNNYFGILDDGKKKWKENIDNTPL